MLRECFTVAEISFLIEQQPFRNALATARGNGRVETIRSVAVELLRAQGVRSAKQLGGVSVYESRQSASARAARRQLMRPA